jgi:Tfp pilus assembly PilM family ATPase
MADMSIVARAATIFRPRAMAQQVGPIGIDIALEEIHLVQLQLDANRSLAVKARVSLPFDGTRRELLTRPHQFRTLIRTAMHAGPFHGRQAVVALPSGMFRTVSINYRSAGTEQQEAAAILRVMKDRLDGDLGNYVLDYMPVRSRSKNDERLAMVAVSEHQPVVALLEVARKARLDVTALEIGPVAISRLVRVLSTDQGSQNVLVINSGRRASYLTLISGEDLLFDQEVAIGEHSLIQQICDSLDMTEDTARDLVSRTGIGPVAGRDSMPMTVHDSGIFNTLSEILKPQFLKLVDEIKRAFLYAAAETRGGAVSQVYLLGSIARWPGADQLLSKLIGVNVAEIPDPLTLFQFAAAKNPAPHSKPAPEIAVAAGAALRGMNVHG